MTKPNTINVSRDFSVEPGPRYKKQGPFSGELFREKCLVPALRAGGCVIVEMDGTEGYGSSFIDEAFGGLVRSGEFKADELLKRIDIISNEDPLLKGDVEASIKEAKPDV
ncbi:STAS-like domain-containing protein [Maricaulis alexandrii]|uniref:STAS-like domain-containing protein n=1 Tax=Maricaulis alexandrii TaxID=2570354 RepID=UPI00110958B5|nr:STAS-like domain-containing protein [Maricaulis alexandrii]